MTMFTTVKTIAALTLGLTILAAAPAKAALTGNGNWSNGLWQNGIWENGIWDNGIWDNGVWDNGVWENGVWQNGLWANGIGMNGFTQNGRQADADAVRVIGIELPSDAVVR
jgi:hypothetical protein